MQDAQWSLLKKSLLGRGWTWREDALYAPHQTMWFSTTSEHSNFVTFRDRMSMAVESTAVYVNDSLEQFELHEDLVSLVGALDELLDN